ncbi:microcystinase MlrC family protease, partial [Rhizobium leguminosarum]
MFTAALATETNTFSPICVDRRAFEASLYAPPGQHPETPTLCTAPITVGRRVTAEKGWELIEILFIKRVFHWSNYAFYGHLSTYQENNL